MRKSFIFLRTCIDELTNLFFIIIPIIIQIFIKVCKVVGCEGWFEENGQWLSPLQSRILLPTSVFPLSHGLSYLSVFFFTVCPALLRGPFLWCRGATFPMLRLVRVDASYLLSFMSMCASHYRAAGWWRTCQLDLDLESRIWSRFWRQQILLRAPESILSVQLQRQSV